MFTYNEIVDFLEFGHEIEFNYLGKDYSITQSVEGWYFTDADDHLNAICYEAIENLIQQVRIGDATLQNVFESGKVKDIYIF